MKIEQILDIIDRPTAWAWIRAQYLPAGVICPSCGQVVTGTRALASFTELGRTYCKSCGGTFQAKAAVRILRGTEWAPEEFCKLLLLHLAGQQPVHIARILGKSTACVQDMLDRYALMGQIEPIGAHSLPGAGG